jgi:uncharacterized protein YndB with AHSA1/START domain
VIDITTRFSTERSPGEVFAYVTTVDDYPRWHARAISVLRWPEVSLRQDSEWWATVNELVVPGRRVLHFVVTECEPNRRVMSWTSEPSFSMGSGYTLEPTANGTLVSCHRQIQLHGWLRLLRPLVVRILRVDMLREARALRLQLAR